MPDLETDYLIVGAGAVGLAFADTLLAESDADMIIVDRHGKPGGHWNDAYAFVTLHQPSAYYGVNSVPLGSGEKDRFGPNEGLYELAPGPEVSAYFDRVMRQHLLASGRVRYLPMCEHKGAGRVVSLLSDATQKVRVRRKIVDATYFGTTAPSTHTPRFAIAPGARLVAPNALPDLWKRTDAQARRFVLLGAGKTAMDAAIWLLSSGAPPDAIQWVMPRDSWLLNRRKTQPGLDFFEETIGGQLKLLQAFAAAQDLTDLFARLEADEIMLRIDRTIEPTMFHYATMSPREVDILRAITQVIRMGRVLSVEPRQMLLEHGVVPVAPDTLFIDCTASAVDRRPTIPIFQDGLITPQMARMPQPAFSAALIAFIEAHYLDDAAKNALCAPIALPDTFAQYPAAQLGNMMNQFAWSQDRKVRAWIRESRLDGFGKVIAAVTPADAARTAILAQFGPASMGAVANIRDRLLPGTAMRGGVNAPES
jgi:hypothetical protein